MVSDEANGTAGAVGTDKGEAAVTSAPSGTAVLLAAAPAGRGRTMDAASVLPALAAVPPGVLTGTATASLVELADPIDPQTVLTRLRAAAQSPGPLVLFLAGQLHLDRRQQLPHLALARSTSAALRYTALPWHWLAEAAAARPAGTTTVVADLVADPEAWTRLGTGPDLLRLNPAPALYARVTAPPRRGELTAPDYLRAWADQWRAGTRLPFPALHAEAAARTGAPRTLFLTPDPHPPTSHPPAPTPTPAPAPAPRQHSPVPAPAPTSVPAAASAPVPVPATNVVQEAPPAPASSALPAPAPAVAEPPAPPSAPAPDPVPASPPDPVPVPAAAGAGTPVPVPDPAPAPAVVAPRTSAPASPPAPVPAPAPASVPAPAPVPVPVPVPAPAPVAAGGSVPADVPVATGVPGGGAGSAGEGVPAAGVPPLPAGFVAASAAAPPAAAGAPGPLPGGTGRVREAAGPAGAGAEPERGTVKPVPARGERATAAVPPMPTAPPSAPASAPAPAAPATPAPAASAPVPASAGPGGAPGPVAAPVRSSPARPVAPASAPAPTPPPAAAAEAGGAGRGGPSGGGDPRRAGHAPAPVAEAAPHDPHPAILSAAMAGRHAEAAEMAAAWERDALRRFGPRSGEAVHWMEVRADLARLAGEPARSCELWLAVAEARLGLRQQPDDRDVEGAVDRAHHQWEQITDPARARALGPTLVALRRRVPGRRPGALEALRRRMHTR
ncbi:hypothetical protein [Streptomyces omiyaensis]|uniref:hypothetical protein n=1 Tax=Streptomyces omiyaensis TaxID=68247 RepID=UPI001E2EBA34|nr:hypothetical protein [Streptomyces omiyaensis]